MPQHSRRALRVIKWPGSQDSLLVSYHRTSNVIFTLQTCSVSTTQPCSLNSITLGGGEEGAGERIIAPFCFHSNFNQMQLLSSCILSLCTRCGKTALLRIKGICISPCLQGKMRCNAMLCIIYISDHRYTDWLLLSQSSMFCLIFLTRLLVAFH